MTAADLIDRRILRLCEAIAGATREDVLRPFADHEHADVRERIDALVGAGKLRREGDRLWRVG